MSKLYQYTPGASAGSYSVSFAGNKAYRGKVLLKNYLSVYRKSRIATKIGI